MRLILKAFWRLKIKIFRVIKTTTYFNQIYDIFFMILTWGHLRAVLGNTGVKDKVQGWCDDIKMLADIAESEPQAAYSAYIAGIQHRWKFVQRTVPHISEAMELLRDEIKQKLLPKMLGREISDLERDVLSSQIRMGGLGIGKPHEECLFEYTASKLINTVLTKAIVDQEEVYTASSSLTNSGKEMIKKSKNSKLQAKYDATAERCGTSSKRALLEAREKGASSWINTLSLQKFGSTPNKEEFRDSVCLRYSWWIPNTPITCGCGKTSDLDHLLTCKLGAM